VYAIHNGDMMMSSIRIMSEMGMKYINSTIYEDLYLYGYVKQSTVGIGYDYGINSNNSNSNNSNSNNGSSSSIGGGMA